jgi:hypothetical protein
MIERHNAWFNDSEGWRRREKMCMDYDVARLEAENAALQKRLGEAEKLARKEIAIGREIHQREAVERRLRFAAEARAARAEATWENEVNAHASTRARAEAAEARSELLERGQK